MNKAKISRAQWLTFGLFLILAMFLVRLFYIQIIKHDVYYAKANAMQINKQTIYPSRGKFYVKDQEGSLSALVLNQTVYTVFADPTQIKDVDKVESTVKSVVGDLAIKNNFDKLTDTSTQYVVLAKQVSYEQAQEIKDAELSGVGMQSSDKRVYTEGNLASQVLGFVNSDGEGQYGLEQYLNTELTGETGLLESVTDVSNIPLTIGTHDVSVPAVDGTDYILTIDRSVQAKAEAILAEGVANVGSNSGSIVIMDPQTGRIVAMANYPDYNPAEYNKVQDGSVFQNYTVSDSFEPGSVMKTLTTGMSLDLGTIHADTTYVNKGCYEIDGYNICNASGSEKYTGQTLTMTKVLQYSLNTGVTWQLMQLGDGTINTAAKQTMYDFFTTRYRFGTKTSIEQPNESAGLIYSPTSVQGTKARYANMTFGQGMSVTMVQMLSAFSAAINGGTYYQPTLIYGTVDSNGNETESQLKVVESDVLSESASAELRNMMHDARTASYSSADNGYFVGAKTGTAQVYDGTTGTYSKTETTGTTIGFGADKDGTARYAIMVRVDYAGTAGFAGTVAANPIFTKMSNWLAEYEGMTK